jgi:hypothetical protein
MPLARLAFALSFAATIFVATFAAAQEPPATAPDPAAHFEGKPGAYARLFATAATGFGFRFNNPYRLSTQLADDASSVSITAPFLDFAAAVTLGNPDGVQHGASFHVGSSLSGVVQPFVTPSYVLAYRASLPVLLYGRLGTPIVLAPDVNVGGELAASVSYFFGAGLGLTSELVFDLFYGAATLEQQYSVIPVLALQIGVIADYEFLP